MKLQGIQIGLASPKAIRLWAERKLINDTKVGPITNPQTVNYQIFCIESFDLMIISQLFIKKL